ncbi:MAG TPA: RNA polymerase sigma factor [Ferruginibacter sp.]|nr:RNA polymerase sigma factor [Ferruginibacter sp.]
MSTVEFNQSIIRNTDYLKPFAITLTRDMESAKDLIQETLYKALANKDKFNDGTNIKAWLYTIMRNIFINNYRRAAKQKVVFNSTAKEFLLDFSQVAIANTAETNLSLKEIKEAVYHLPEIFKIPFELYIEGYKYHEVADILSEPLGTIKSRIHFARKLLKQQLSRF